MSKRPNLKLFTAAFLATILTVICLFEFGVVERISYEVEKGRLRAIKDARPASDELAPVMSTRRAVSLAAPAVVSIETEFTAPIARASNHTGTMPKDAARPDRTLQDEDATGTREDPDSDRTDRDNPFVQTGLGSGFIFDADHGHILTNAHVVDGARQIKVTLADGRETNADVLGADHDTDLAVIRIPLSRLHALTLADSTGVQVGDDVLAVGNPFGLEGTVTKGIISATDRGYLAVGDRIYMGLLQTDAVITTGNSGGPLIDMNGQVIGVNTAMATGGSEYDGVGFAIPSSRALVLVDDLITGGPGFLGIYAGTVASPHWRTEAVQLGWKERTGALVTDILRNTAADRAGLESGDIILAVDDVRVESIEQLSSLLAQTEPGTEVNIELWRDRRRTTLAVTLGRKFEPR
ncbi:MAG: trypsin-like peptidase domain-containing protein [Phycisphaerae bacterium]|jgi:S1-C subfamily serine protease